MTRLIHVRGMTGNYRQVNAQITGTITCHLDRRHYVQTQFAKLLPRKYRLVFGLFIRSATDVLMSHGVADKNYLTQENPDGQPYINSLEHLFVPGPWLKAKILASPGITLRPDQITSVGWPRLDLLQSQLRSLQRNAEPAAKVRLLWAPTHDLRKRGPDQTSSSSFPVFAPFYEKLSGRYETAVSVHPRNRTNKAPTGNQLLTADVVISDFGTMVYEAWALGKPVIFPYWLIGEHIKTYIPGSAEAYIFENEIGYHPKSFEELEAILAAGPVITPDVTAFLEAYLPKEFLGRSGQVIAQKLVELAQSPRP